MDLTALLVAACSLLLTLVLGLVAWSARREIGLVDQRAQGMDGRAGALEERVRKAEIGFATLTAHSEYSASRLDELAAELHSHRELLNQILARLPKRAGDVPAGGA